MKKQFKRLLVLIILVLVIGFVIGNKVISTVYFVKTEKIDDEITIVQITDIYDNLEDLDDVIYATSSQNPDFIFLTGDIFYKQENYTNILSFINNLTKISKVIFVRGHSDSINNQYIDLKKELKNYGVTILEDSYVDYDNIRIIGLNDTSYVSTLSKNFEQSANIEKVLNSSVKNEMYNIVLAHRPQYFTDYVDANADLVVSGHTSGGIIKIPFANIGFFAKDQGLFPKYDYGLFEKEQTKMIINSGISENSVVPRLFNPKEIVVIRIEKKWGIKWKTLN